MKKSISLLGIFLMLSFLTFSQTQSKKVDIKWGPKQKASKRSTLAGLVGVDDDGFYALKRKAAIGKWKYTLELYDHEMNLKNEKEIIYGKGDKQVDWEWILLFGDNLYLFTSKNSVQSKSHTLYVQELNKKSLLTVGRKKKLVTIDYSDQKRNNLGNFRYEFSEDQTKLLIYHDLPFERTENEQVGFSVFDEDLKELWSKEYAIPVEDQLFEVRDYEITNDGDVYLLGKEYEEKAKNKRKGKPNFTYLILGANGKSDDLKNYRVEISGKFLTDMQIAVAPNQDIVCGGFYSDEGTTSIKGSYFLRIDASTKEIKSKSFNDFGIDFITQNLTERKEKKVKKKADKGKDVELYEYDLDDIILDEQGNATLIGEQYFIRTRTYNTTNANGTTTTRTVYVYHYNDIIVIKADAKGNVQWTEKIPKRQITTNDGGFFSSYVVSNVDDKLYFIFNDNPKNLMETPQGKIYNFNKSKESLVVLVQMDKNGKQVKEPLFSSKDSKILTRPKVCTHLTKDQRYLLLFGQYKKTHRFARLKFK